MPCKPSHYGLYSTSETSDIGNWRIHQYNSEATGMSLANSILDYEFLISNNRCKIFLMFDHPNISECFVNRKRVHGARARPAMSDCSISASQ